MKRGQIMDKRYAIKLFDEYKIKTKWGPEIEDYYYSILSFNILNAGSINE